jgi:hypothetical protein
MAWALAVTHWQARLASAALTGSSDATRPTAALSRRATPSEKSVVGGGSDARRVGSSGSRRPGSAGRRDRVGLGVHRHDIVLVSLSFNVTHVGPTATWVGICQGSSRSRRYPLGWGSAYWSRAAWVFSASGGDDPRAQTTAPPRPRFSHTQSAPRPRLPQKLNVG